MKDKVKYMDMKYAVVDYSGTQYKVSEKDKIKVNRVLGNANDEISLDKVVLFVDDKLVDLGKPYLKNVQVKAKIVEHLMGEKVIVAKFRAKTGYHRRNGFRAKRSTLSIEKISAK